MKTYGLDIWITGTSLCNCAVLIVIISIQRRNTDMLHVTWEDKHTKHYVFGLNIFYSFTNLQLNAIKILTKVIKTKTFKSLKIRHDVY